MKTPTEAEEMFDVISYRKGACIIRMLYDWIGGEVGDQFYNVMYAVVLSNLVYFSTNAEISWRPP